MYITFERMEKGKRKALPKLKAKFKVIYIVKV